MLVVTPAVVVPVIYFARKYRLLSEESQAFVAESNAYANQVLSLIETVRAYQYEAAAQSHFSGVIEAGFRASKKRIWARSQLTVMIMVLVISAMVAVLWLGTLAVFLETWVNRRRYWSVFWVCSIYFCSCSCFISMG